jgi:hypothetical protein
MSPPENANRRPRREPGGSGCRGLKKDWHSSDTASRPVSQAFCATVAKSLSSEIRVTLKCWRGAYSVDLREATASIPGVFFPTSNGVTLDIAKLAGLIAALEQAQAQAQRLGLLDGRPA